MKIQTADINKSPDTPQKPDLSKSVMFQQQMTTPVNPHKDDQSSANSLKKQFSFAGYPKGQESEISGENADLKTQKRMVLKQSNYAVIAYSY